METLPNWLEQSPTVDVTHNDVEMGWALVKSPQQKLAELQLSETVFDLVYEDALDRLMMGHPVEDIVGDHSRNRPDIKLSVPHFLRWIKKDKNRKQQFDDAMEMGGHIRFNEMIRISDGVDNPMEDVARSTLRVNTRKLGLKAYSPKLFGEDSTPSGGSTGGITVNITGVVSPYSTPVISDISGTSGTSGISDNVVDV